jgi:YVTN family beta-propeller protein
VGVNPFNNLVYIANWYSDTVSVLNGTTNSLLIGNISTNEQEEHKNTLGIELDNKPTTLAMNPSTQTL